MGRWSPKFEPCFLGILSDRNSDPIHSVIAAVVSCMVGLMTLSCDTQCRIVGWIQLRHYILKKLFLQIRF